MDTVHGYVMDVGEQHGEIPGGETCFTTENELKGWVEEMESFGPLEGFFGTGPI